MGRDSRGRQHTGKEGAKGGQGPGGDRRQEVGKGHRMEGVLMCKAKALPSFLLVGMPPPPPLQPAALSLLCLRCASLHLSRKPAPCLAAAQEDAHPECEGVGWGGGGWGWGAGRWAAGSGCCGRRGPQTPGGQPLFLNPELHCSQPLVVKQLLLLTPAHPGWPLGQVEKGAHLTSEGFLPRVLQRVHFERHASFEGLPAGLAGEGHVLGVGCGAGHYVSRGPPWLLLGDPCLTTSHSGPPGRPPCFRVCLRASI